MTLQRETLQELHRKLTRKNHLNAVLRELYAQQRELKEKVNTLDTRRIKEQSDVDRLEGRSLAAFFYRASGKMDEKLDQERIEAYAAAVRYDAAVRELAFVEEEIARSQAELGTLLGCEDRYALALQERFSEIKAAGGAEAQVLLEKEKELCRLESQKKELEEAISAGETALTTIGRVEHHLSEADSYSTWDMFGGGMLVSLAKHEELDAAQSEIEQLQVELRRFRTELTDVSVQADIRISLDDFTRFFDVFFDGLFADLAVQDEINRAWQQVKATRAQIESMLGHLRGMRCSAEDRGAAIREEMEHLAIAEKA